MLPGIFAFLLTLVSCSALPTSAPGLAVWYSATEQDFFGGVKGSPSGTVYSVEMCAPVSYKDFMPGDMHLVGKCYRVGVRAKGIGLPLEAFAKGDTILLSVSVFRDAMQKTPSVECRHALRKNDVAYLTWREKGREEVLHLSAFRKLEPLIQP
jgi:hypothetical protein